MNKIMKTIGKVVLLLVVIYLLAKFAGIISWLIEVGIFLGLAYLVYFYRDKIWAFLSRKLATFRKEER